MLPVTVDSIEGNNADIAMVDIYNGGIDPIDLIARIEHLQISKCNDQTSSTAAFSRAESAFGQPIGQSKGTCMHITSQRRGTEISCA